MYFNLFWQLNLDFKISDNENEQWLESDSDSDDNFGSDFTFKSVLNLIKNDWKFQVDLIA